MEVARRLTSVSREADTLGRFGGDEFALLVEDVSELSTLTHLAQRVLTRIAEPHTVNGQHVVATPSIGSVFVTDDRPEPQDVLRDADVALHHAKQDGRSRHALFDAVMQHQACMAAASWPPGPPEGGAPRFVAVNVSPLELRDGYPAAVRNTRTSTGLPANRLVLEIIERVGLPENDDVVTMLEQLTTDGVRVVIDDFGTDNASLGRLRR